MYNYIRIEGKKMIKFIIYDESRENKELIYDEIDKEMMKSDIEYLVGKFADN